MISKTRFFLFLFTLILLASPGFAIVVKLRAKAVVSGRAVFLRDIAEIQAFEGEEKETGQWEKLELFPLPDEEVVIRGDEIKELITRKIRKDFVLIGESVIVYPHYTRILEQEIIEKIKSSAVKHYPFFNLDQLRVLLLQPLGSVKVPYGDIRVRAIVPGGEFHRIKVARLEIWLNDRIFLSKTIMIKLIGYMQVFIAKESLSRGEKISKEKLIQCYRKISGKPEDYFHEMEKFSFCARKYIPKGKAILKADLQKN
jgi:hypothetical protein